MKAPTFNYVRAQSVEEASKLLQQHPAGQAVLMAGGQTLVATLNMRLSEPDLVIDLCDVPGISGISCHADHIRIGALTTHSDIEDSLLIERELPLLATAVRHIAHRSIRNRGTIGGSIAYADPAAEWPACALALDATIVVESTNRVRHIKASDFFLDLYTTALEPSELITTILFPKPSPKQQYYFSEIVRRHGDYAIAGLAATAVRAENGSLNNFRLAFLGICTTPWLAKQTAQSLEGISAKTLSKKLTDAKNILEAEITPTDDLYHSASTKLYLAIQELERGVQTIVNSSLHKHKTNQT